MEDRSGQWRRAARQQCEERGVGGLSARHCPGGPRNGTAGGDYVHGPRLERADTDQAGIRGRAGDQRAPPTAVPRHDAVMPKPRLRDPPAPAEPMLLERLGHRTQGRRWPIARVSYVAAISCLLALQ